MTTEQKIEAAMKRIAELKLLIKLWSKLTVQQKEQLKLKVNSKWGKKK